MHISTTGMNSLQFVFHSFANDLKISMTVRSIPSDCPSHSGWWDVRDYFELTQVVCSLARLGTYFSNKMFDSRVRMFSESPGGKLYRVDWAIYCAVRCEEVWNTFHLPRQAHFGQKTSFVNRGRFVYPIILAYIACLLTEHREALAVEATRLWWCQMNPFWSGVNFESHDIRSHSVRLSSRELATQPIRNTIGSSFSAFNRIVK